MALFPSRAGSPLGVDVLIIEAPSLRAASLLGPPASQYWTLADDSVWPAGWLLHLEGSPGSVSGPSPSAGAPGDPALTRRPERRREGAPG